MEEQRPRPEQAVVAQVRPVEGVGVEFGAVGVGGGTGPEDEGVGDNERGVGGIGGRGEVTEVKGEGGVPLGVFGGGGLRCGCGCVG